MNTCWSMLFAWFSLAQNFFSFDKHCHPQPRLYTNIFELPIAQISRTPVWVWLGVQYHLASSREISIDAVFTC